MSETESDTTWVIASADIAAGLDVFLRKTDELGYSELSKDAEYLENKRARHAAKRDAGNE